MQDIRQGGTQKNYDTIKYLFHNEVPSHFVLPLVHLADVQGQPAASGIGWSVPETQVLRSWQYIQRWIEKVCQGPVLLNIPDYNFTLLRNQFINNDKKSLERCLSRSARISVGGKSCRMMTTVQNVSSLNPTNASWTYDQFFFLFDCQWNYKSSLSWRTSWEGIDSIRDQINQEPIL